MSVARTDADAISAVRKALNDYARQAPQTASAAETEMSSTMESITVYAESCVSRIESLESALAVLTAQEEPDHARIAEVRAQLASAERKLAETRRLANSVGIAHEQFRAQERRYRAAIDPLVEKGAERMRNAREDVLKYQQAQQVTRRENRRSWKAMSSGGLAGAGGSYGPGSGSSHEGQEGEVDSGDFVSASSSPGGSPVQQIAAADIRSGRFTGGELAVTGLPDGMVLVPLRDCVDDGRVVSAADFGKASADDLQWAAGSFFDQVLPRVERGGDVRSRLADTDGGRGYVGDRSLAATYDGFLGSNRLKVNQLGDGRYEVQNGAHRIWAAQAMGLTHLPAAVRRLE